MGEPPFIAVAESECDPEWKPALVEGLAEQIVASRRARLAGVVQERDRIADAVGAYLAAFDRAVAVGKAFSTTAAACEDIEDISDESWAMLNQARYDADARLAELRAAIAGHAIPDSQPDHVHPLTSPEPRNG